MFHVLVEFLGVADHSVEHIPKVLAMIFHPGVYQLMLENVVDQLGD